MSDELFEVAFSGQILKSAEMAQVKVRVAAMFKADAAKLAHLFSGKRVVIKKNIDQATATKYKNALTNAGALCEIKSLSDSVQLNIAADCSAANQAAEASTPAIKADVSAGSVGAESTVTDNVSHQKVAPSAHVPAAPQTDPLGIVANDISDLPAAMAPLGSDMQDEIKSVQAPQLDLSGMDMAPAGTDLGQAKKADEPSPPNTDGLSLVD